MTVVWVLLVIVVLGVTAAVAIGRGDGLGRAHPDRPEVRLPAGRPLSASDLSGLQFSVVLRGYRMDEVDDVIHRLTAEVAERDTRLIQLEHALRHPQQPTDQPPDRGLPWVEDQKPET